MEGEQSRFLGLILGMDPLSLLSASNLGFPTTKSTDEINKYRSAVKVKHVVELIAFLHVIKIIYAEDHIPFFYMGKPIDPDKFKKFAKKTRSGTQEIDATILCERCQCSFRCLFKDLSGTQLESF